jgi:2-polyprenyl-6-methoxyphenol hydroxylase-like FAD-dependent oxidoreductase
VNPGLHIAIVGYGTAGQACAALLARDGHACTVFERAPALGPVGAGLLLQPTGLEVLWRLGLFEAAMGHGAVVRRLHGQNQHGRAVMDMRYAELDPRLFGLGMQRGALFALLRDAWSGAADIRCGRRIVAVETETGHVSDERGERHGPFDLVVAADGSGSALRHALGPPRLDQPYPWGALWCLCPADDWAPQDELRQRYVAARKMIGLLPVGTRPDDPRPQLSFFWSLPTDRFEQWQRDGHARWSAEVEALWPEAAQRLAAAGGAAPLARATYRDAVLGPWQRHRLVLVGDAAHAMSPQLGQGVNMALMDAWALRESLRAGRSIGDALMRFQRERRAHTSIYQFWSRWLTPVFQSERDTVALLRDLLLQPLGRLPGGRGNMLRVLSGTQRGWLGRMRLDPEFLEAMGRCATQAP